MKSNIWGPYAWMTLHVIPFCAEIKQQTSIPAKNILLNLHRSLPCSQCQDHFGMYLESHPPASVLSPKEFSRYICSLHNHVSSSLGSPVWDENQVMDFYGYQQANPQQSQLRFWSRNFLLFLYLAMHSPQVQWQSLIQFAKQTGKHLPWSPEEEKLWNKMISCVPQMRNQGFAWFEEFKPAWMKIWEKQSKEPWPPVFNESPYLRRMKWVLTSSQRNPAPAVGTYIPIE